MTATANSLADESAVIRVISEPSEPWFSTEVEAITEGLLTETETTPGAAQHSLRPRTHALAVWVVRMFARQDDPFTAEDVYRAVAHGNVPVPQGTTSVDLESLLRRLKRVNGRAGGPASATTGGDSA